MCEEFCIDKGERATRNLTKLKQLFGRPAKIVPSSPSRSMKTVAELV